MKGTKIKMNFKRTISSLLIGVLLFSGISGTSCKASIADSNIISEAKNTKNASVWPAGPNPQNLSCGSAIVMEVSTGLVLYKKNIHKQHYPASITKIMTSLLALENASLSDTITFSSDAVYGIEPGSSTVFSEVGEKMSLEQCLYAIMLESANEVCLAVGEHVAGTSSAFVDMMNDKVAELGLKNTHFNNPNGLPDPDHYTTAYDMAVIAREAIKNSSFKKISGTRSYTCEKTNKHKVLRYWRNHHQMINGYDWPKYEYKYIIGGKTGYTQVARSTLVTYAEKDGMQLVCVIMYSNSPKQGEPNEYTDTTSLLNFGFEKYKKYNINDEISESNSRLFDNYGSYFNSKESPIHLSSESSVVLPKGVPITKAKQKITYYDNVKIEEGENTIGKVTYSFAGKTVGSTDIIYTKSQPNYLDEASRQIVNSKIQDLNETSKKNENTHKFLTNIKAKISGFFGTVSDFIKNNIIITICVIGAILLLLIILFIIKRNAGRSNRIYSNRHGGYRSRGGKRNHARRQRAARKNRSSSKRARRNHSKHYAGNRPAPQKTAKRRSTDYSKRRKNTKESFGKNYFDF